MEGLTRMLIQARAVLRTFLHSNNPFRLEPSFAGMLPQYEVPQENLPDKKSEGFVWGVPKKRRSVEVRWCRKLGAENWHWKMFIPKYNLRICENCGHHYEAKHLCRNCYEKVKAETNLIRERIETELGNNAEDKGVVVLYEEEKGQLDVSRVQNKLLVEVPKPRPAWFAKNLLQKTTAVPDHDTTTVVTQKPNLG